MSTFIAKNDEVKRAWYVVDAEGKILGRLATKIAGVLRGKHKPEFTYHVDVGDNVIVINAGKIKVTGKKAEQKLYKRFSGYPGGLKEMNLEAMLEKKPADVVKLAVWGMIPKGKLGRKIFKKLKVYSGSEHPHAAQKCKELNV